MSSWMNDAAVQNHNGNGFPHMTDPNAGAMMDPQAFMASQAQFNPAVTAHFANPQQMMAMQNGPMRNASPSFSNPVYQTNPVIPSKRPRPREDGMAASSPRQNPSMLATSRAETPQQAQFQQNFNQAGMPQQNSGQPYPHLQPNGSANATPSPIMGNQMRPGSVPQRVSTTSPHPFSPAAQNFGPQASPVPPEQSATPQQNPYMQQGNFPPGFNQNFTPSPSPARPSSNPNAMGAPMMPQQMGQMPQQMGQMAQMNQMNAMAQMNQMGQMNQMAQMGQMPNQMFPQQMQQQMGQPRNPLEQQKLMYQMQLQRQLQQQQQQQQGMANQMQGPSMAQQQQRNMMARQQQMPNGQMPPGAMRPQQQMPQQQPMRGAQNPEQFMKNLTVFMRTKNLPLETTPMIGDRPVSLLNLFSAVQKAQGYRNVCQGNAWGQISNMLGFPPMQFQVAPAQFKGIYERNLLKFEDAWNLNKAKSQQQGMSGAQGSPTANSSQPHMSSGPAQPGQQVAMQPGQAQTPIKQSPQGPTPQPGVNGFSTPQPPHSAQQQATAAVGHSRNSLSRSVQATPTHDEFPMASPAQSKAGSVSMPGTGHPDGQVIPAPVSARRLGPDSSEYAPCSRDYKLYGGVDMDNITKATEQFERWKPDIPPPDFLGNIDIHALTRSIQSRIRGEVRLALDTLASVTFSPQQNLDVDLTKCDDLCECLIECAEDQVNVLVDNTVEVSDELLVPSYEKLSRACRLEKMAVREIPIFGTPAYDLDRAVDRLICITTILRNLSFNPQNQPVLADESVIKFLCVIIRYVGTRTLLLRTHANTLDFMKDVVILLSNVAGSVELPDREQAFCLLHFLLVFAPSPAPSLASGKLFFATYEPALHPYLPPAVDALAKLLARDEPNRTHYKQLFAGDANNTTPNELLTKTFALAISPIPDQNNESRPSHLHSFVDSRKAFLMQGLLAADILASLAPGHESGVTRAWLACGNGFAQNLFRLIRVLSMQFEGPPMPPRGGSRNQQRKDTELVYIVGLGVSMLRRLSEKAKDPSDPSASIPPNLVPSRESILGALQMQSVEWTREGFLQQLLAYAALED